ncbi:MAG: type II secretion system F family protein [Candidatus Falkowbacteria bacterium]|nr:type II secretion system F family protein [Candidatus Falkowbacteria bacterium]
MAVYSYSAKNSEGRRKHGRIVAMSENDAAAKLGRRELSPIKIRDISRDIDTRLLLLLSRPKNKDLVVFSRQFSVMISAGVPIVESLKVMVDQAENLYMQKMIIQITSDVDGGATLSDSLAKYPKFFSYFFVNIVRSGETSGKLDEVLDYLADEMEKNYDMSKKFSGAMIYPAFIISALGGVAVMLMVFIIPQLTAVLTESGAALPVSTRMVLWLSDFLRKYLIFLVIILVAIVFLFRAYIKTPQGKRKTDQLLLRLPIFGDLFNKIYLIRFTRSLSTLLKGGVTITRALEVSAAVAGNMVYQDLIRLTLASINDGRPISSIMEASDRIPKMVPQMMAIGERTGKLDMVLDKVTDFYSREVSNKLNNLSILMEPIIMVVLGVGVAVMVAAVILPMYNMASQF